MRISYQKMWVYALFVMWLFPQWSMADIVQKLVVRHLNVYDGMVSFLLSENPEIRFLKNWEYAIDYRIVEITTTNSRIELSQEDLDQMTVVNISTNDITNIANDKESTFKLQGDALFVEVGGGNTMIAVYDVTGKNILSKTLGAGKHALSLSDLPKGMCIIKINNESLKIWNR